MQPAATRTRLLRIVQSRQNSRVKELRAAFRQPGQLLAVEGEHLLQEALRSGLRLVSVFVREGSEARLDRIERAVGGALPVEEVFVLPPEVFASAVETESPQGIAALIEPSRFTLADVVSGANPLVLVAAGLQDPGNFGTLVRTAEAMGASGVLSLRGTVNLWNSKALRASSGSAFRLPVAVATEAEALTALRKRGVRLLAAVATGGTPAPACDLTGAVAILVGNEGSGVSPALLREAHARITIASPGPVESLNAAIAGSILLYEAARQRATTRLA